MKLQTFDGGLHTRPKPQFINQNQGVVYENIDSDAKSLVPVNLPLDTGTPINRCSFYYVAEDQWVESSTVRDYVEFQKKLYWTDRVGRAKKYDGSTESNLGIDVPSSFQSSLHLHPEAIKDIKVTPANNSSGLTSSLIYYIIIAEDKATNEYSNALHISVDEKNKVKRVNDATNDPVILPVVEPVDPTRRQVTFDKVEGVNLASYDIKIFRQYQNKWKLAGSITDSSRRFIDKTEDISSNIELDKNKFGSLQGVYQYVLTFYNDADGSESGPSNLTDELDLERGGGIELIGLPVSTDPQVDKKRIYRIGGNVSEFTLVDTIDNSDTSYTDNIKDSDLKRDILDPVYAKPAPVGLAYLTTAYAMLFGAEGSKLRFTPVGKPDSWPEEYFLDFPSPITGIVQVASGLLVFTQFQTHIVTGTGPLTLSQYLLSGDQGCIAFESIQQLGTEAIWASEDGLCSSSGGLPTVITKQLLGKLDLDPVDSILYDGVYYILESDGSMLALDKGIIKKFDFGFDALFKAKGKFYGRLRGNLAEVFGSSEPAFFKFKSARFIEGAFTAHKTYKKLFTYSTGLVKINILINDIVVQSRQLTSEDSFEIQVPQDKQRGFYLQLEIEGTGEVSEIEYRIGQ